MQCWVNFHGEWLKAVRFWFVTFRQEAGYAKVSVRRFYWFIIIRTYKWLICQYTCHKARYTHDGSYRCRSNCSKTMKMFLLKLVLPSYFLGIAKWLWFRFHWRRLCWPLFSLVSLLLKLRPLLQPIFILIIWTRREKKMDPLYPEIIITSPMGTIEQNLTMKQF